MNKIAFKGQGVHALSAAIILLFLISLPCFAELTENDIRQIREVIREEIKPLEDRLTRVETRLTGVETKLTALETKVEEKFNSVEDKIALSQWFIGLLVAMVVAAIAIPQLLVLLRERKELREIEKLWDAIAELKEKRVITS